MSEKQVLIICPTCQKQKKINAPIDIIKKKETGATSVYIPARLVCEHEFYAYIDKNFAVRDYLVLEFSLQDEAKKTANMKSEVLSKASKFNIDMPNVYNFISKTDLRSLLYACFIGSPLILIENDPSTERFGVLFNLIARIYPDMVETCNVFTPEKFLEYSENQKERLLKHTVFNVIYKLSVLKPFGDSDSEPFDELMNILEKGSHKLQSIYAKNFVDYLTKFSEEIKGSEEERSDKISKILKKKFEQHQDFFTIPLVRLMKRRLEFMLINIEIEDASEEDIQKMVHKKMEGVLFIYNDDNPIRQAESLPDITQKHTLRLLRKNKTMSIDNIVSELHNVAREMIIEFDYHKLPEILEEFSTKGYISKI